MHGVCVAIAVCLSLFSLMRLLHQRIHFVPSFLHGQVAPVLSFYVSYTSRGEIETPGSHRMIA